MVHMKIMIGHDREAIREACAVRELLLLMYTCGHHVDTMRTWTYVPKAPKGNVHAYTTHTTAA